MLLNHLVCFLLVPHVFVFVLSRQRFQRENEPLQIDCSIRHAEDMVKHATAVWFTVNPLNTKKAEDGRGKQLLLEKTELVPNTLLLPNQTVLE